MCRLCNQIWIWFGVIGTIVNCTACTNPAIMIQYGLVVSSKTQPHKNNSCRFDRPFIWHGVICSRSSHYQNGKFSAENALKMRSGVFGVLCEIAKWIPLRWSHHAMPFFVCNFADTGINRKQTQKTKQSKDIFQYMGHFSGARDYNSSTMRKIRSKQMTFIFLFANEKCFSLHRAKNVLVQAKVHLGPNAWRHWCRNVRRNRIKWRSFTPEAFATSCRINHTAQRTSFRNMQTIWCRSSSSK